MLYIVYQGAATAAENQGATTAENQGATAAENQGATAADNQGATDAGNQGATAAENQGATAAENQYYLCEKHASGATAMYEQVNEQEGPSMVSTYEACQYENNAKIWFLFTRHLKIFFCKTTQ